MHVRYLRTALAAAGAAALMASSALASASASTVSGGGGGHQHGQIKHVLLLSVDGLHQQDLAWYVKHYPDSALATLVGDGIEYTDALTPIPSDSSPGMIAQVTGGDPGVTGIYYDDTFNHDVFPAGTTNCSGRVPGGEAAYEEAIDINPDALDAGQGLSGLPGSILQMTSNPLHGDQPRQPAGQPEDLQAHLPEPVPEGEHHLQRGPPGGLRTAWSDKHPAYQMFDGPSGNGVAGLLHPRDQQRCPGYPAGEDWTSDNAATMQYDNYKVQAILNEIDGYNHSRTSHVGVPGIFGMNFQTISTAQKLPTSDGLTGGYLPGGKVPGPLLVRALNYLNTQVGRMVAEIRSQGLAASTALVISAKHGQSPTDPSDLRRVPDAPIIAAVNAAWTAAHPGAGALVSFSTDDDGMLWWLSDRSQAAADFVKHYLLTHRAAGNNIAGSPVTVPASGLAKVYAGAASAAYFGVPNSDPRHPDIFGIVQHGVVYTGGQSKIAEHGGAGFQDRNVPILVDIPAWGTASGSARRSRPPRSPRRSSACSA